MRSIHCWLLAGWLLFPLYTFTATAQQVTGAPGSPGATQQLPPPDPPFGAGRRGKTASSMDAPLSGSVDSPKLVSLCCASNVVAARSARS